MEAKSSLPRQRIAITPRGTLCKMLLVCNERPENNLRFFIFIPPGNAFLLLWKQVVASIDALHAILDKPHPDG